MWEAIYCTDGETDVAKTEVESMQDLEAWVAIVNDERGVTGDIFKQKQYSVNEKHQQWGTDYWWLSITREEQDV